MGRPKQLIGPEWFCARVRKQQSGCWIHLGSVGSHGYAQRLGKLAHRVSWTVFVGEIPDGMFVLHRCNVKRCVNPEHLYLGTHEDNMDDVSRGRYHPKRKLTTEDVEMVRASARPIRVMARELGVSQRAIQNIKQGKTYRHG